MNLTNKQVQTIVSEIENSSLKSKELKDDLIDHFCCAIEIYISRGLPFEEGFKQAKLDICPNGLNELQQETIYLLNSKKITLMKRFMFSTGLLFSMALGLGFLFKLMHWPGGTILSISGALGLGFVFIPSFTLYKYRLNAHKIASDKMRYLFGLTAAIIFSLSIVFKLLHLMGANVLLVVGAFLFLFGYLPFMFFTMYKKSE